MSTDDQNPDLQNAALNRGAVTKPLLMKARAARPLATLPCNDTLTVWKLDRLGRSVRDVMNTLHDLTNRGVQFQSLTEQIDTTYPSGNAMLHMVALLPELERGLIVERTKAGQQAARRRGVKF